MASHIATLIFSLILFVLIVVFAIFDNKDRESKKKNAPIYIFFCFMTAFFFGIFMYECGVKEGAYGQMRGKYKITYKTTTINDGDNEVTKTDTIIKVFK